MIDIPLSSRRTTAFAADLDAVVARARTAGVDRRAVHPRGRRRRRSRRAAAVVRARGRTCGSRSASTRTRPATFARPSRRGRATVTRAAIAEPSARARSARSASTTTTTSRRATCSRRSSARRSRWRVEPRSAGRHPHPRSDDDTFAILRERRRGQRPRRVPLLHRRRARWRDARSTSASTSRSPAS